MQRTWNCSSGSINAEEWTIPLGEFSVATFPSGGLVAVEIPRIDDPENALRVFRLANEKPLKEVAVEGRSEDGYLTVGKAKIDHITLEGGPGLLVMEGARMGLRSEITGAIQIRILGLELTVRPRQD